eukprot:CAMPEP_0179878560 /NCGR_PEP_ID=MMETSP0982-20121206/25449_1 /TAXON_ID=483367 /ORGANISM="non described non described, Strain CCMP 2436" /LENGTH=115 /DNA_ID=CAMNT_0021771355 /DNA_START=120 /DNA_END=468 /DNA_ORIENTATION=+
MAAVRIAAASRISIRIAAAYAALALRGNAGNSLGEHPRRGLGRKSEADLRAQRARLLRAERAFLYHFLAADAPKVRAERERLVRSLAGGLQEPARHQWIDQRLHILDQLGVHGEL